MINFELLREFNNKKLNKTDNLKENLIKYQEYELIVDNNIVKILIPLRESENFENYIKNIQLLNKKQLKDILFNFRGFRNIKNNKG